ncbi:unnamed protein product [Schistosoma mattheei]|uniref:Uncharacterized protein n=1 Tax=Schistosoma mattheei TaxID=31246 RepID=A0A3P8BW19_9TREM|nr:unnamed protein product [Schistosoma mattheei]
MSWAILSGFYQFLFILDISGSISRRNVFFGLPLFRFPSGFQVTACLVTQFDDLRNICPIHFHRLFLISSSAESWFVLYQSMVLLMVSVFINACIFLIVVVVVLQVSAPYSRTALTFVLEILTLILVESCFEFHMFFNRRNATLALPILAFTPASEPPCSSMMLPRYVKDSTSSRVPPSKVIGLLFSALNLRTLVFPLCMLRPTDADCCYTDCHHLHLFVCT